METNNIPSGTLRITISNALQYVIMALFYMIVTKTNALTQADIGALSILSFLASTFSLITTLALPTALTKFASENLGKNQLDEAAATQKIIAKVIVVLSVAGFLVVTLFSTSISQYFFDNTDFIIILLLNFGYASISNIMTLFHSTLQALFLFGKMATMTIIYILTSRVIAIILAFLNLGSRGVMIGYIIGALVAIIIGAFFLRRKLPKTTKRIPLKPLLTFSFPLLLSSITALVLQWADVVILNSLTGDLSLTGVYHIAVNSVGFLSILYIPMTTTIFPVVSANYGLEKKENISNILKISSRYLIYILIPACVSLAIISKNALSFFYGVAYAEGAIPLAILSITAILVALLTLIKTIFQAVGKTSQILKINVFTAILTVILLFSFIPLFQITGAALARLITQTIGLFLAIYLIRKEINISIDKEALWKSVLSTLIIVPILYSIEIFLGLHLSIIQTLILQVLIAVCVYLFCMYALKAVRVEDFELLKQAFPKFLRRFISLLERLMVR